MPVSQVMAATVVWAAATVTVREAQRGSMFGVIATIV
jgi:hypothetical protein